MIMNKLIIITGLTASGKSEIALNLAKKYNGEIISADSVQVYRGLDIGSAKPSVDELNSVKHHLINIKDFNQNYNVGQFIEDCKNAINIILENGKLPIIVGGTGLYIQALINGYNLGNVGNDEFRQKLNEEASINGNLFVWNKLNDKDPELAAKVHPNNLKRVIRYLELIEYPNNQPQTSILKDFDIIVIGLIDDREVIYKKIDNRVDKMIALGLENEVKNLIKNGANSSMQSMTAIGYKEWFDYFNGNVNLVDTINLIKQHTRNYCKRQLTFLKKIPNIKLCNKENAINMIESFLKSIN